MEDTQLYQKIKENILSSKEAFYISILCKNKEELSLKSKLLFDVIQRVKINYRMFPFNYLMCLDTFWNENNFDCKWKIFRTQYIDNPHLGPYINTGLNQL